MATTTQNADKFPPRYAMSDWHQSNVIVRTTAQRLRDSSHRIRQEGRWLRNESDNHTRWTQHDSDTRMEERIDDVNTWRKSLEKCLSDTDEEIRRLEQEKERCERALAAKKVPLDISLECLMLREQRIGIDLVRDPVEANLGKVRSSISHFERLTNPPSKSHQILVSFDKLVSSMQIVKCIIYRMFC